MNAIDTAARYYFNVWKSQGIIADFTVNKYGKFVISFRRNEYGEYNPNDHCTIRIPTNIVKLNVVTEDNIKLANQPNYMVHNGVPVKVLSHEEYLDTVAEAARARRAY